MYNNRAGTYPAKLEKGLAMASVKISKADKLEAEERLRELFDELPKKTAYTVTRKVSSSGMTRRMSVFVVDTDGDLRDISYYVGAVLGWSITDVMGHRTVRVDGCGMDMGFHLVYSLSYALYRDVSVERSGYVIRHEWA
jgi:predicted HAD superfamily phosphohydrolase